LVLPEIDANRSSFGAETNLIAGALREPSASSCVCQRPHLAACRGQYTNLELYLDHIVERGRDLSRLDLDGVVGKWIHGTYQSDGRETS
jgi:hypothetical protein